MAAFGWRVVHGGKTPPPGEVVRPDERLSWPRTVGLGAQHVVAMFGATFVFPLIMGLNPQLAIMMSGIATICFLLIVNGQVPSYLGTSASFVGGVVAIRAQGGTSADVTGAILVAGGVLALVGVFIHFLGFRVLHAVLPPVVTGAVVMLIGFNLAPVVATIYWPQDQWVALATMAFVIVVAVGVRGFISRIAIFVGLVFGYVLSWMLDRLSGPITSVLPGATEATSHDRVSWSGVADAAWFGFPPKTGVAGRQGGGRLAPARLQDRLRAAGAARRDRTHRGEHRPCQGGGRDDEHRPRPGHGPRHRGRRCGDDGHQLGRRFAHHHLRREHRRDGGDPDLLHRRVLRGRGVAILFGFSPKFGAVISATPGGVLGGITVVLYGMIGLLGAKIWKENRVDFGNPINLVPVAAGIIIAIGNTSLVFTDSFQLSGIALGTIVTIVGYHVARAIAPPHLRELAAAEGPDKTQPDETVAVPDQRGSADAAAGVSS